LLINCFWASGQYKGKGYDKELLQLALEDAKSQGKDGLVTVYTEKNKGKRSRASGKKRQQATE